MQTHIINPRMASVGCVARLSPSQAGSQDMAASHRCYDCEERQQRGQLIGAAFREVEGGGQKHEQRRNELAARLPPEDPADDGSEDQVDAQIEGQGRTDAEPEEPEHQETGVGVEAADRQRR